LLTNVAASKGPTLQAGKTKKWRVPKDVAIQLIWALIVYDFET
jgi:hypothetical protein